jgi:catechol 2,3-dioxygenase-like lactoylglutathione lyase family enzyme
VVPTRLGHGKKRPRSRTWKAKPNLTAVRNQKINLRPVSADKEEWVTADNEEAGSEDLCFLTDTTPKEVIDHLKNCGVAIEEGMVNKQGAVGSLKSAYCRDPDGSLIEISAYED